MGRVPGDDVRRDHDPTTRRNARLLAVLVLLSSAAVATGIWLTGGRASGPSARVPASPAGALSHIHAPPTDRPLIWLAMAGDGIPMALRLRAVDWNGREVGEEGFGCLAPCSFVASPDGHRVLVREQQAEGQALAAASVFDSTGALVGRVVDPVATWADDGRRLCSLHGGTVAATPAASAGVAELDLVDPAAGSRNVVAVLASPQDPVSSYGGWQVLACSTVSDRVIAVRQDEAGLRAIRVLELSTGRILYTSDPSSDPRCACAVDSLVVSHDASVAIENFGSGHADLIDLHNGAVTSWPTRSLPLVRASGVSWNGHRTAIAVGHDTDGVAEIPSGTVTWRAPVHATLTIVAIRPGTDDLALFEGSPRGNGRVVIVLASGYEIDLAPTLSPP